MSSVPEGPPGCVYRSPLLGSPATLRPLLLLTHLLQPPQPLSPLKKPTPAPAAREMLPKGQQNLSPDSANLPATMALRETVPQLDHPQPSPPGPLTLPDAHCLPCCLSNRCSSHCPRAFEHTVPLAPAPLPLGNSLSPLRSPWIFTGKSLPPRQGSSHNREPAGTEDRLGQDSKDPQAVTHPCGPPNNLQGVTVTVPVLQTRKLRHRDIKQLTKLRCQDSGPKSGASSPEHASLLLGASCAHPSALRSLLSVSLPSRPAPPDTVVTS